MANPATSDEPTSMLNQDEEPGAIVKRIRQLLGEGQLQDARSLVNQALQTYPNEPELLRIQRLITPGRVTSMADCYPDRKTEFNWIACNRVKHRGKWVALIGEQVIAMEDDAEALMQALKHQDLSTSPLVHHLR